VSDDKTPAKEERDGLGTSEGYVVITQQDIVDGVACFVARSISSLPQSKVHSPNMFPSESTLTAINSHFFISQSRIS